MKPIANQMMSVVSRILQTSLRLLFQRKSPMKKTVRSVMSVIWRMRFKVEGFYHSNVERLHTSDLLQARHRRGTSGERRANRRRDRRRAPGGDVRPHPARAGAASRHAAHHREGPLG